MCHLFLFCVSRSAEICEPGSGFDHGSFWQQQGPLREGGGSSNPLLLSFSLRLCLAVIPLLHSRPADASRQQLPQPHHRRLSPGAFVSRRPEHSGGRPAGPQAGPHHRPEAEPLLGCGGGLGHDR